MNLNKPISAFLLGLVLPSVLLAQSGDLAVLYPRADETVSQLLFEHAPGSFEMVDAFRARSIDLAENHPRLTVAGDFTGDGLEEIALFEDLLYVPNLNPEFTCCIVRISRSVGDRFIPSGTWFSVLDTALSFAHIDHAVAWDYNQDGFSDIALFYNDPSSQQLTLFVLESDGSSFSEALPWYSCDRNDFNFTAVEFACAGDYNGNGKPDIAVFYNYVGTAPETRQSLFLFESDGTSFELLPAAYDATKAEYDFSDMKFAMAGNFNSDSYTDLAVWMSDPTGLQTKVPVFQGSASGQLSPADYFNAPSSEWDLSAMVHAVSGNFTGDEASDLAVFYDHPGSGDQEILILESKLSSFASPELAFSTDPGNLNVINITSVVAGTFAFHPVVSAATWKEDKQGAVSFTFDDGYRGAFEHGGAELEAAGLLGTYYIFTDTTLTYDGEIAGTSLVREYKNRGHEIGSHSSNHSDLGLLSETGDYDSLSTVLSESVTLLNARFDQNTLSMAIPFGSFRPGTLDSISNHFLSARSSQYGYNLATPYDFYALKSWPVLSTTSAAFVDNLVGVAESYGTYLPLMYHDMLDEPFDKEVRIYTYGREDFRETLQLTSQRNVWIDTHQNIYKYIRMRNALRIEQLDLGEAQLQPGHFSFVADDYLPDSVFDVGLTLLVRLPDSWTEDSATVEAGDQQMVTKVLSDGQGSFLRYNCIPSANPAIHVYEGRKAPNRIQERKLPVPEVLLAAFPNPFIHETRITVSGPAGESWKLVLLDMQGKRIREIHLHHRDSCSLYREDLSPGMYILQLLDSELPVASIKLIAR